MQVQWLTTTTGVQAGKDPINTVEEGLEKELGAGVAEQGGWVSAKHLSLPCLRKRGPVACFQSGGGLDPHSSSNVPSTAL